MSLDRDLLDAGLLLVVGIQSRRGFEWYGTTSDFWFLNDRLKQFSEDEFFEELRPWRVETSELRNAVAAELPTDEWWDVADYSPSLSVNFQEKTLVSVYSEPESFEHEVPQDWQGTYDDRFASGEPQHFLNRFPKAERFWIIDGRDEFARLLAGGL